MSCLEASLFSDPLSRLFNLQIKENRYYFFKKNGTFFWDPKVFINGNPVHTLLDTGASCSVMSLKLIKKEAVQSFRIELNPSTNESLGQAEIPIKIDTQSFKVYPHIMENFGCDWCNANGAIVDFNKRKVYFVKPQVNEIQNLNDSIITEQYAYLNEPVVLLLFHETQVNVKSSIPWSTYVYVKSYLPLVERVSVFAIKGETTFENSMSQVALTNFTKHQILLPKGTIIASIEKFDSNRWDIHDEFLDITKYGKQDIFKTCILNKKIIIKEQGG